MKQCVVSRIILIEINLNKKKKKKKLIFTTTVAFLFKTVLLCTGCILPTTFHYSTSNQMSIL